MKKLFITAMFLALCVFQLKAQKSGNNYSSAIGIKFYPGGISYKTFIKNNVAIEGVGYFWEYGSRVTALYQFYGDINGANGLKWYAGPGAHIGFWNDKWKSNYPTRENGIAIGIDGVLGLDYKFSGAPINLSIDWQPSFNLVGYSYFESGWGGLGIRYTF